MLNNYCVPDTHMFINRFPAKVKSNALHKGLFTVLYEQDKRTSINKHPYNNTPLKFL